MKPDAPTIDKPPAQEPDSRESAVAPVEGSQAPARVDVVLARESLKNLRQRAKSLAEGPGRDVPAALQAYSSVEDEALKMLDKVCVQGNEDDKGYFTFQYKEILEESNQFVASVFTPEYIESQPWTDLLAASRRARWQHYGVQDFRLDSGVLRVFGPSHGSAANGLIDFPDAGGYRDFDLEIEFALEGTAEIVFRLGRRLDNTVEYYNLSTKDEDEPLHAGRSYVLRVKYIGNRLSGEITPPDMTFADVESNWTKSRRGAIGVQLHEQAQLSISRMRIRVLRGYADSAGTQEREIADPDEQPVRVRVR